MHLIDSFTINQNGDLQPRNHCSSNVLHTGTMVSTANNHGGRLCVLKLKYMMSKRTLSISIYIFVISIFQD